MVRSVIFISACRSFFLIWYLSPFFSVSPSRLHSTEGACLLSSQCRTTLLPSVASWLTNGVLNFGGKAAKIPNKGFKKNFKQSVDY